MGKLIGNLITGDHVVPKPAMPFAQKMRIAVAVFAVVSLSSFLVWRFINYREESRVTTFLHALADGQYDRAYSSWDADDHYKMKDFLDDFGKDGFYSKGMRGPRVVTSRGSGGAVVVCVELGNFSKRLPILVNKESLKLSYSPVDKCN